MSEKDQGVAQPLLAPRDVIASQNEAFRRLDGDVPKRSQDLQRRLDALAEARAVSQAALDLEVSL